MGFILYIAAFLLLLITAWDVFITVFSLKGAGPITRIWTGILWRILLAIHRRRSIHSVLALSGPFMLLATIIIWYILLGAGFFLVFAAHVNSVVDADTGKSADLLKKLYFIGSTVSSLGYGDLVAPGFPWTLASTIAAFAATVVLTVSLSYVISVLAASIDRRALAQGIFGLGATVPEIIERARLPDPANSLKNYFLSLSSEIDDYAHKHLAYPVLHFFHAPKSDMSPPRAILLLSDSFFILRVLPEQHRPPDGLMHLIESSIGNYADLAGSGIDTPSSRAFPEHIVEAAQRLGATTDQGFERALENYRKRRSRLTALCREDGWYA